MFWGRMEDRFGFTRCIVAMQLLMAALMVCTEEAKRGFNPIYLRPLPYLLFLADGDTAPSSFNVFSQRLGPVQKVIKRCGTADCSPDPSLMSELGLPAGPCARTAHPRSAPSAHRAPSHAQASEDFGEMPTWVAS